MTKHEQYEKGMNLLASRRQRAIVESQRRREAVLKKLPQIASLEQVMSQSAIKLSRLILSKAANASEVIPKIMHENLSMQEQIASLLTANGYPADYLKVQYSCGKCDDTGFVDGERCECFKAVLKKIAVEDFNQATSMHLCTFQDFKMHFYTDKNRNPSGLSDFETMSQIYRFCRDYASSFSKTSPSILMIGNTGLGKTHLSLSIANEVIQKGYSVLYGSAQEYFAKIQNEFFGKNRDGQDTMSTVLDADLFILDDLGAEYESSFNTSTFYNIINSRLSQNKATIMNTNLSPKEIEARYTNRVASRLMTLCKCLKFVGTDIRQMKLNGG